jgi:hypothetical protein
LRRSPASTIVRPDIVHAVVVRVREVQDLETSEVNPELEVLRTVACRLDALGIACMVTGSMAVSYYAVPRMTRDIDVVVELSAGEGGGRPTPSRTASTWIETRCSGP